MYVSVLELVTYPKDSCSSPFGGTEVGTCMSRLHCADMGGEEIIGGELNCKLYPKFGVCCKCKYRLLYIQIKNILNSVYGFFENHSLLNFEMIESIAKFAW